MSPTEHKQRKDATHESILAIQYALKVVTRNKPADRSPLAHVFTETITELQKANGFLTTYGNAQLDQELASIEPVIPA